MFSSDNKSGYFGVTHNSGELTKPYQAKVKRGGKMVHQDGSKRTQVEVDAVGGTHVGALP